MTIGISPLIHIAIEKEPPPVTSRMTDVATRAWTLLTSGQRPRSFRCLVHDLQTDDRGGMSSETVIIVAVLIVVAIGVGALITTKIMDKAQSIHF